MTADEKRQLDAELCRRWKGKFSRDDLDYWAKELDGFDLAAIIEQLTKWKNTQKWAPKVKEIIAMLPRRVFASAESAPQESYADSLRRQNRQYEGRCDAEVILRYHRSLWVTYGNGNRNLDSTRRQLTRECVTSLIRSGMDEAEAERHAAFIFEDAGMFRMVLDELRGVTAVDPFA
jgi:hypothetical protein